MNIKTIVIIAIQGIVGLCAVVALIVALTTIQSERRRAAVDSCYLLRELVNAATPAHGSPADRAAALRYVDSTPLANCKAYGNSVTR